MYLQASEQFKEAVKNEAITSSARLTFKNFFPDNTELVLTSDNISDNGLKIADYCYNNGKLIGTAMTKEAEIEIKNPEEYDLADKYFDLETGVLAGTGEYEYIPYGEFKVSSYQDLKSNKKYKIISYDNMTKLNPDFKENTRFNPIFPISMKEFYREFMASYGIEIEEQTLPNEDFIVDVMPNFDGYTGRSILMKIAEVFGSFAKINRNNKCQMYLKTETEETIELNQMNSKLEIDRQYGPVNVVTVGMSNVEGENVTLRDDESISAYGETMIRIDDNPFLYTEALRESVISDLYNHLHNFTYVPVNFKSKSILYFDCGDMIKVRKMDNTGYVDTIILNQNINIPRTRQSSIETKALTNTEQKLQYISQSKQASSRTEVIVDKQNKEIQAVVEQTDTQNQKIAVVEQTVGELNSKISDIADITTSKESTNARIDFEGINQSEPIYIHIHPIGENISYLYPHSKLFPSDTLFLKNRKLRFTNTTTNEVWDYELPANLLIYDSENYDEFILDYDSQTVMVNKRCGYNADGTVKLLDAMTTYSYDFPKIELTDGDYTVELLGYNNAYMLVRLMAQNIYTTQFATKAEMNSEIKQTAQEIDLSVNKKLENYSTTTQMNSAINVKANEITSTVSETYETKSNANNKFATKNELTTTKSEIKQTTDSITSTVSKKVGNDEVISKINQSAETVGIKANKVELSVNDILNLLAGNTINLTSKNIAISSTNFSVDKNGKATMKDVSILGGNIDMVGDSSTPTIRIRDYSGDVIELYPSNFYMAYDYPPANAKVYQFLQKKGYYVECLGSSTSVNYDGIITPTVTQTSLEELKKNFEKLDNKTALDIVLNTDIYKYHLKSQEDTEKKHIGFVIGDKYKYSKDITSNKNDGVDNYSMTSASYGAIQKLYEIIQEQQKKIEELERITKGE